eukprot:8792851-Pyramimonas_sp.AAC.1
MVGSPSSAHAARGAREAIHPIKNPGGAKFKSRGGAASSALGLGPPGRPGRGARVVRGMRGACGRRR